MEQEGSLLHLLIEHQIVLFCIGAVLMLGLLFVVGYFIGKRAERKEKRREK